MTWNPAQQWPGYVPPTSFDEYSKRYASFFRMRRHAGIIEARLHTNDGPYKHTPAAHNVWARVWQDIGNDPNNHVLIITGTGEKWMVGDAKTLNPQPASALEPNNVFQRMMDGWKHIESFVNNIDIPTISAVNGPGVHTELALLCDVTLAAPDADFMDPHFWLGSPPGDGQGMALQALMGPKRAAYYIYGGKPISASLALQFGIVSDVVAREELLQKAWDLAGYIMKRPRYTRWATHSILSRQWKKTVAQDFGFHMSQQMLANVGSKALVPSPQLLADPGNPF